jgi:hypothetical protein
MLPPLLGIGVIVPQITLPAMVRGISKVDKDDLGVTDVQVAVRLAWGGDQMGHTSGECRAPGPGERASKHGLTNSTFAVKLSVVHGKRV